MVKCAAGFAAAHIFALAQSREDIGLAVVAMAFMRFANSTARALAPLKVTGARMFVSMKVMSVLVSHLPINSFPAFGVPWTPTAPRTRRRLSGIS